MYCPPKNNVPEHNQGAKKLQVSQFYRLPFEQAVASQLAQKSFQLALKFLMSKIDYTVLL